MQLNRLVAKPATGGALKRANEENEQLKAENQQQAELIQQAVKIGRELLGGSSKKMKTKHKGELSALLDKMEPPQPDEGDEGDEGDFEG